MGFSITFHRAANAELIEAIEWYESKRAGLAIEFLAEIDRCVSLAAERPFQFSIIYKDIRRIVTHRFPYSIYFRANTDRIVVLAVFHGSRKPTIWRART
ncbi:MAG: type II toxin-antitoxin system RelE/ParE family toxin [Deltaproteobacteria bacterium]|nr:type II toxin-antitoxin system RelE/ParE family toxin [Deltaproteobacteria bacterium]